MADCLVRKQFCRYFRTAELRLGLNLATLIGKKVTTEYESYDAIITGGHSNLNARNASYPMIGRNFK